MISSHISSELPRATLLLRLAPPLPQVVLCANTPEEHAELVSAGVRSIYFNHCAALDERIFCITPAGEAAGGLKAASRRHCRRKLRFSG